MNAETQRRREEKRETKRDRLEEENGVTVTRASFPCRRCTHGRAPSSALSLLCLSAPLRLCASAFISLGVLGVLGDSISLPPRGMYRRCERSVQRRVPEQRHRFLHHVVIRAAARVD